MYYRFYGQRFHIFLESISFLFWSVISPMCSRLSPLFSILNFYLFFVYFFIFTFHHLLKDWLDKYGDYEAIVDGANVGLYQQNFADGGFSVSQVVQLSCWLSIFVVLYRLYLCFYFFSCFFSKITLRDLFCLCFTIEQLDAVVKELYNRSGKKWPLVVLHNKRYRALLENASHRKFVDEWMEKGVLYTTPNGSNDDW